MSIRNSQIMEFKDMGRLFYRAQFIKDNKYISRVFNTRKQARDWIDYIIAGGHHVS
jgi:hypothetical protein